MDASQASTHSMSAVKDSTMTAGGASTTSQTQKSTQSAPNPNG